MTKINKSFDLVPRNAFDLVPKLKETFDLVVRSSVIRSSVIRSSDQSPIKSHPLKYYSVNVITFTLAAIS
jgi:hypothetical protein